MIKLNFKRCYLDGFMREMNLKKRCLKLMTPEILFLLSKIHEFKGEQNLFLESRADELEHLLEVARIQSTEASNKIEGIYTSNERLKLIALDKTMPKTRDEFEIAGYRDVLNTIHKNYEYIPVKPSIILQFHRDLYKFSAQELGGRYKNNDNVIKEFVNGKENIRFIPVAAWETPGMIEKLCFEFEKETKEDFLEQLLLIPLFVLDFLCIHPFRDGNGRMSRLLTLLLLYRAGYIVGKYISIEKLMEQTKDSYYEALKLSSLNWHEASNNDEYFVKYMLGVIISAYKDFSTRIWKVTRVNLSKTERVRELIKEHLGTITKAEIVKKNPDISEITIQRALAEMLNKGEIIKINGGRYAKYIWNQEGSQK